MKLKLAELSRQLDLHPANALLYLKSLVGSLDEVWPDVDSELIESVRGMDWQRFGPSIPRERDANVLPRPCETALEREGPPAISREATHILDKLVRNRFWGGNKAARDKIRRNYCSSIADIEPFLEELKRLEYIEEYDNGHSFSLNTSHKGAIDRILDEHRRR